MGRYGRGNEDANPPRGKLPPSPWCRLGVNNRPVRVSSLSLRDKWLYLDRPLCECQGVQVVVLAGEEGGWRRPPRPCCSPTTRAAPTPRQQPCGHSYASPSFPSSPLDRRIPWCTCRVCRMQQRHRFLLFFFFPSLKSIHPPTPR